MTRENDPAAGAKYAGRLSSDAGLTLAVAYALFLLVLVIRPRGLFGTP